MARKALMMTCMVTRLWLYARWMFRFTLPMWGMAGTLLVLAVLMDAMLEFSRGSGGAIAATSVLLMAGGLLADLWRLVSGRMANRAAFIAWTGRPTGLSRCAANQSDTRWQVRSGFGGLEIRIDVRLRPPKRRHSLYAAERSPSS